MKSKPQITTALPPIFQIKSKKNSPLNNIYTKFPAVNPPRGRQLYKKAYDLLNNQEINISNNSTCETKRIINNNIKNKKESRPVRIHNRRITKDKSYRNSDSSNSFSRECRKKKFCGLGDDTETIEYPTKKDVGLISSEDEESADNSLIEENFSNEIERILIEIYNKNISSLNNNGIKGKKEKDLEMIKIEQQKYKEKIYEIPEIKKIFEASKLKKINKLNEHQNPKLKFNFDFPETFSNFRNHSPIISNYHSQQQNKLRNFESIFTRNSLLLQVQEEITEHGVTNILLRELINIKHTLKISSKEIENLFKYPLSLLKDDTTSTQINFSIELMQMEEFSKILLDDEFISTLILQIKIIFSQIKVKDIIELIAQVEEDKTTHKNEMTKFDEFINNKLKNTKQNENINNNSSYSFSKDINEISQPITKETVFTLTSASSVESINDKNDNNITDIDELVKYISEEPEVKKPKKKKNKKLKKGGNNTKEIEMYETNNSDDFDKEIENFKNDIEKSSVYPFKYNKKLPFLSSAFIKKLENY